MQHQNVNSQRDRTKKALREEIAEAEAEEEEEEEEGTIALL